MAWTSNWMDRFFGRRSLTARVESIVAKVEPAVWQVIDGRVPMGSPEEVRGYVWASSAATIRLAVSEYAADLDQQALQTVIRQARHAVADRIVSQLQIFADQPPTLQRAA